MTKFLREFRLIPVVLLATACLLGLKVLGLVLDGGFTLADFGSGTGSVASSNREALASQKGDALPAAQRAKSSWAGEMFNYPDVTGSIDADKASAARKPDPDVVAAATKLAQAKPPEAKAPETKPPEAKPGDKAADSNPDFNGGGGTAVELNRSGPSSPAERAILERLGERRQELDARARELDIRENLLKSAEKRLDTRVNDLKAMEAKAAASGPQQQEKKAADEAERLKGLVTMYENMKPRDAAKIFDRLELPVLIAVVSQIKPRVMADIMAQMQPDTAERLTTELASRATGIAPTAAPIDLPKIEGHPQ
jgi:flagellar motility protein MotE (MotC chaperone)